MSAALQAQTSARFSRGTKDGNYGLAIVGDPGAFLDALVHLLLIPDVPATLVADVGRIILGQARVIDVPGGILTFSNSAVASLPMAPLLETPTFRPLFAFDSTGQVTSAFASWDYETQQVRLTRAITGAIAYTKYKTTARAFTYEPLVEAFGQGSSTTYGVIAAYYQGTLVIHETSPPSIDRGNATIELYRRYSYKVANRDGEFEAPPNYPGSGAYPATSSAPGASLVIEVDGSHKYERVHEIGYIDKEGRAWVWTPNVNILEPYVGVGSYTPTIACRIATLSPEQYPRDLIARAQDFIRSKNLGCKNPE